MSSIMLLQTYYFEREQIVMSELYAYEYYWMMKYVCLVIDGDELDHCERVSHKLLV